MRRDRIGIRKKERAVFTITGVAYVQQGVYFAQAYDQTNVCICLGHDQDTQLIVLFI